MPNSLRSKIKHLAYKGEFNERERDRLLRALDHEQDARVGCEYCKHKFREQHERPCSLCQRNFMDMFERKVNADDTNGCEN